MGNAHAREQGTVHSRQRFHREQTYTGARDGLSRATMEARYSYSDWDIVRRGVKRRYSDDSSCTSEESVNSVDNRQHWEQYRAFEGRRERPKIWRTFAGEDLQHIEHYDQCGEEELESNLIRFVKTRYTHHVKRDFILAAFTQLLKVQQFRCYITTKVFLESWRIGVHMLGGGNTFSEDELKQCNTPLGEFIHRLADYMAEGLLYCDEPKGQYHTEELYKELIQLLQHYIRNRKL